ncbi:something about silencing, SAS, complex subunit 4-domain-containing protein [Cladorrhinum sp. PSN332]|nr:something about silencing, SAS, complex subunit 4-domain-containing protein [Cladorrhinum sp. PSN332]
MAMTTSMTRSRRAEGLHPSHPHKIPNGHRLIANNANQQQQQQHQQHQHQVSAAVSGSPPRAKRPLDTDTRDRDPVVHKKPRFATGIAVEIPARVSYHSRIARESADAKPSQPPTAKPTVAGPHHAPQKSIPVPPAHHLNPPPVAPATRAPHDKSKQPPPLLLLPPENQQTTLTKHQEKIVNGLKHELGRLHPNAADTKEQQGGRKLRSQEATRFRSELSAYFPDYDEVIGNEPKEEHLLNVDTPIVITSDAATTEGGLSRPLPHSQQHYHHHHQHQQPHQPAYPVRGYGDALFTNLFDSERIDFDFLNKIKPLSGVDQDPLPDSVYEAAHKKAERVERSIRNTEKGRAQHERDQIIRLLDGLQGHDWLRVMGVSGITETRKKQFEPAREHFISGCKNILDKFRRWTAEEKRRKQEKEHAAAEAEKRAEREAATSEEQDGDAGSEEDEEIPDSDEEEDDDEQKVETDNDEDDPPDDSDADTSIAKQLRVEALAAAAKKKRQTAAASSRSRRGKTVPPRQPPARARSSRSAARSESVQPPPPPPPEKKELTTFFAKPYQREAALSKNRRKGRNVLAWGQPIPEMEERDFQLPGWVLDEGMLKARARKRRREKRVR